MAAFDAMPLVHLDLFRALPVVGGDDDVTMKQFAMAAKPVAADLEEIRFSKHHLSYPLYLGCLEVHQDPCLYFFFSHKQLLFFVSLTPYNI
jgi:hypothetical protein